MVRGGCRRQWLLRDRRMSGNDSAQTGSGLARGVCVRARLTLTGLAFRARRAAELRPVAAREMRWRLEAAGRSDIDDRHRGLQQQLAGATPPEQVKRSRSMVNS